jgi:hypothetical protein
MVGPFQRTVADAIVSSIQRRGSDDGALGERADGDRDGVR